MTVIVNVPMVGCSSLSKFKYFKWEAIVVRTKAGIGYHGVIRLIPPSDLSTFSAVGKGEVTVPSRTNEGMYENCY
jgi:hypothetical protein